MKILYLILLFVCANARATTYYVSKQGNDANSGTSTGTAWRTVAKVNASRFAPGDKILFRKGDTWNERLNPPSSGSTGKPIIFGSYGKGVKPLISGLQTLKGFTNNGNIWTATATNSVPDLNTVLIGGAIKAKGRYPNSGYLTFTSYNGNSEITGSLPGKPDYTGSEVVVRTMHWIIDVSKIVSQSSGTLTLSPALSYVPKSGGNGYFIQNNPLVLDTLGEWAFDSTTKKLTVYSTEYPTVQISTIDTLISVNSKSFITFDGLSLVGANAAAVQLSSTDNITIQNCSFNYSGRWAIAGVLSTHVSILKDSIQNTLSNAIYFITSNVKKPGCDYALIDDNYIKNSGIFPGMALVDYTRYCGIFISGIQPTITNNRIDSTGYIPIIFIGPKSLVKNNYVSNFCFVKDDGGGIYTVVGKAYPANYQEGSIIRSNVVANGIGALAGTLPSSNFAAPGIYLDDNSSSITVDSNTILNCMFAGINLNRANSITVRDNTIVNKKGAGLAIHGTNEFGNNMDIKRNIIILESPQQVNVFRHNGTSVTGIDSNYYSGYRDKLKKGNFNLSGDLHNFSKWSSATGQDLHSISIPMDTASSTHLFFYNPDKKVRFFKLDGTYYDAKGQVFEKQLVLKPFCSAVLFKADPRKTKNEDN